MTKEELCKFCDPSHPKMCGPFSVGDYTYATNGHILLRVPRLADVPEWEAWNEKSAVLFDRVDYTAATAALVDIPDFTMPEPDKCPVCKGAGKVSTCPECEGEGEIELENGFHVYHCECETCDGLGTVKGEAQICHPCSGTGKEITFQKVAVGCTFFSSHYLTLMKEMLPCVSIAPTAETGPNYFKWDGGDGLLMPMRD